MLDGSVEVWTKNILYQVIEGQTHFDMPSGAKLHLTLDEPMRLLLIQIQKLTPRMHHK